MSIRSLSRAPVILAASLALALAVAALAAPAEAEGWRTTRSAHFTAVGDASDARLRDVLARLEQFRDVLARVSPGLNLQPSLPIVVFVLDGQASLRPFAPLYDGRVVSVGGLYVNGITAHFLALDVGRGTVAYPVAFHEFTHLFLRNTLADVPVWFNEGLAGFYETFELSGDRRDASIGLASGRYIERLRERMLSLDELLAVTTASPLYNEGDRRSVFYAQAWALTHYLLVGNPERARQLPVYLQALIDGVDEPAAFATAFGATTSQLQGELAEYLRRPTFTTLRYDLGAAVDADDIPKTRPMAHADAATLIAEFQFAVKRRDEARERLTSALADNPDHVGLLRTRALFDIADGRPADAIAVLDPIASDREADAATLEVAARAHLAPRADLVSSAEVEASQRRARALLTRVVALDPNRAEAHEMLARLHLRRDGDAALAERHARAALALAPVRADVAFVVADAQVKQERFEAARATLGTFLAHSSDPNRKARIRAHLVRITGYEARVRDARAAQRDAPPPPIESDAHDAPAGAQRVVPVYRELERGEERLEGALAAIECSADGVALTLDLGTERRRFPPTPIDQIAFITYRDDLTGQVTCGPWKDPHPVMITWRPSAPGATTGPVVAIEFPPALR